jgi:signal transduction histidine kinase
MRCRVLVGGAVFLLLFDLLAIVLLPQPATKVMLAFVAAGYVATLGVARRTSLPALPALLLCVTMSLGFIMGSFTLKDFPYIGTHSAHMLVPALAVYLVGPRPGLAVTVFLMVAQTVVHPLFLVSQGLVVDPNFWPLHIASAISFVGAWGLGTLHSTARDAAQASLERTLRALRESVTAYQEAEVRLSELHRTLVDVSRRAGMAEVATGVLHNVGNTLNSVNISTGLVIDQLRKSRVTGLAKAVELLREHSADVGTFLSQDPQGRKFPSYLMALSTQLQQEREALLQEMHLLRDSVDHIKSIVSMQQKHARAAGALESIHIPQLIDEALRLHAVSFERRGIRIEREYAEVPPVTVDRHKLLQILINLLSNARHALSDSGKEDKRLSIRVRTSAEGERLLLEVSDNGKGIAPEHLKRMFTQGFTTKPTGHGFGLHISALSAAEMKGKLSCASAGPGQGATFTLELPVTGPPTDA